MIQFSSTLARDSGLDFFFCKTHLVKESHSNLNMASAVSLWARIPRLYDFPLSRTEAVLPTYMPAGLLNRCLGIISQLPLRS